MKRRDSFTFVIIFALLMAGLFFSNRTNQLITIPNITKSKTNLPHPSMTDMRAPKKSLLKEKEFKRKSSHSECVDQTLLKLARACDNTCLFNHIRNKDPELEMMMMDLKNSESKKDPVTKIGYFYHAFFYIQADPLAREKTLRFLVENDSENAYPSFFLAELISNEKPEESKIILEHAVRKKKYESYYTEYFRKLKQVTIDRSDVYARAILFNRELQIFQLNVSVLWGVDELDRELAKKVALKIIKPTLDARGAYGDILWNREDYLFGRYLLEKSDPTEHALLPDYDVEELVMDRYAPGLTQDCSIRAFLEEREREKQRLLTIPKS